MISLSHVAKAYGANELFHDVTFQLVPGRRVALVGGNGVGKTTLLEIVVGLEDADSGQVTRHGGTTIGYLPQDVTDDVTGTVLEHVLAGAGEVQEVGERLSQVEVLSIAPLIAQALSAVFDDTSVSEIFSGENYA